MPFSRMLRDADICVLLLVFIAKDFFDSAWIAKSDSVWIVRSIRLAWEYNTWYPQRLLWIEVLAPSVNMLPTFILYVANAYGFWE